MNGGILNEVREREWTLWRVEPALATSNEEMLGDFLGKKASAS